MYSLVNVSNIFDSAAKPLLHRLILVPMSLQTWKRSEFDQKSSQIYLQKETQNCLKIAFKSPLMIFNQDPRIYFSPGMNFAK